MKSSERRFIFIFVSPSSYSSFSSSLHSVLVWSAGAVAAAAAIISGACNKKRRSVGDGNGHGRFVRHYFDRKMAGWHRCRVRCRRVISWAVPMPPRRSCTEQTVLFAYAMCRAKQRHTLTQQVRRHTALTCTCIFPLLSILHLDPPFHLSNASPHGGVAIAPSFSYAHRFRGDPADKNPTDARVLVQPLLSF